MSGSIYGHASGVSADEHTTHTGRQAEAMHQFTDNGIADAYKHQVLLKSNSVCKTMAPYLETKASLAEL